MSLCKPCKSLDTGEGFALVVEILNEDGQVVGTQPVTVQAPDLGQPGIFSADMPYSVSLPVRVIVRDPSQAYGCDVHLNSVAVNLEP